VPTHSARDLWLSAGARSTRKDQYEHGLLVKIWLPPSMQTGNANSAANAPKVAYVIKPEGSMWHFPAIILL
jgi:hypothetical protein